MSVIQNQATKNLSNEESAQRVKLASAPTRTSHGLAEITEIEARSQSLPRKSESKCTQFSGQDNSIIITFRSKKDENDYFVRRFSPNTTVGEIKKNVSELLTIPDEKITLECDELELNEETQLIELNLDLLKNLDFNIITKGCFQINYQKIPHENLHEIKIVRPKDRKNLEILVVKFRVMLQQHTFTISFPSSTRIHEIKTKLGEMLHTDKDNIMLLKNKAYLVNRLMLGELAYDEYGNVDIELYTKDNKVLNLDAVFKSIPVADILTVTVATGNNTFKQVNVEVIDASIDKPYLGGYRNSKTGLEYHHAYTQTQPRQQKVSPRYKNCRDTQTAEEKERIDDTCYSRPTQMAGSDIYIPNVTDRILVAKPYETYDQMVARLNHQHYATIIQRAYRAYRYRLMINKWLKTCQERLRRLREEEEAERQAYERRLKKHIVTSTFPRTREDFDQLYAMVDRWKNSEISRISQLHSKGPKIAEFSLLLDKEVELLRCIESYRIQLKEDNEKVKEKKFLEEISKPIVWFSHRLQGKIISMDTMEAQRSRKLKDLYFTFARDDLSVEERMELLVDMKYALKDFKHPLTADIINLMDRECDLIVRNYSPKDLDILRKRTQGLMLQFIKTSELNAGITRRKDEANIKNMSDGKLYLCEMCQKCKSFTEYPLYSKMNGFLVCTSCSWKNASEKSWVDMSPYKFILRAVRRDERRRKSWGSLAFVLQEKDIFFIIEKLWHSHSAISENTNIFDLRLCRWYVNEDWAPWNCLLCTIKEMKAHLKLRNPDITYDAELVKKIKNKHMLAKSHFEQLTEVEKHYTEGGHWHAVRAGALDFEPDGIEPLAGEHFAESDSEKT